MRSTIFEHAGDLVRALADLLEIVADRLLARQLGKRAEDGLEEAGILLAVSGHGAEAVAGVDR